MNGWQLKLRSYKEKLKYTYKVDADIDDIVEIVSDYKGWDCISKS